MLMRSFQFFILITQCRVPWRYLRVLALNAVLIVVSQTVQAFSFHEAINPQSEAIFQSHERFTNTLGDYMDQIEPFIASGDFPFSQTQQQLIARSARGVIRSVAEAHTFSRSFEGNAFNPEECAAALTDVSVDIDQTTGLVEVFEGLDVEGEDKAEAMNMLAMDFMAISMMVSDSAARMLLRCLARATP